MFASRLSSPKPHFTIRKFHFDPPATKAGTLGASASNGLHKYRLGSSEPPVTIYPGTCDPAWSPDGKWILCPGIRTALVSPDGKRFPTGQLPITPDIRRDEATRQPNTAWTSPMYNGRYVQGCQSGSTCQQNSQPKSLPPQLTGSRCKRHGSTLE